MKHHPSASLSCPPSLLPSARCSWSCPQVAKVVAPKKAKLEEMNSLLAAANATLATKQVHFFPRVSEKQTFFFRVP